MRHRALMTLKTSFALKRTSWGGRNGRVSPLFALTRLSLLTKASKKSQLEVFFLQRKRWGKNSSSIFLISWRSIIDFVSKKCLRTFCSDLLRLIGLSRISDVIIGTLSIYLDRWSVGSSWNVVYNLFSVLTGELFFRPHLGSKMGESNALSIFSICPLNCFSKISIQISGISITYTCTRQFE